MKFIIKEVDEYGPTYTIKDVDGTHDFSIAEMAHGGDEVALWVTNDPAVTIHMPKEQAWKVAEKLLKIIKKLDD